MKTEKNIEKKKIKLKELFAKERIKEDLLTGLIVLGPALVTIYVILFILQQVSYFFTGLFKLTPGTTHIPYLLQVIASFLLTLFLIYLGGALARTFVGKQLILKFERLIAKIPMISDLYSALRELADYMLQRKKAKEKFKNVVLTSFPYEGSYVLGFLSSNTPIEIDGQKFYKVFVPTTPNPTSGWFFIMGENQIEFLDISVEEALKIVISAGIVHSQKGGVELKNGLGRKFKKIN